MYYECKTRLFAKTSYFYLKSSCSSVDTKTLAKRYTKNFKIEARYFNQRGHLSTALILRCYLSVWLIVTRLSQNVDK